MVTAGATRVGAAWCAVGEYGGGLLGGDCVEMDVAVGLGGTLLLSSQGSTKVFKSRAEGKVSQQTLRASVATGALLVVGLDPVIPFAAAKYEQRQTYVIDVMLRWSVMRKLPQVRSRSWKFGCGRRHVQRWPYRDARALGIQAVQHAQHVQGGRRDAADRRDASRAVDSGLP